MWSAFSFWCAFIITVTKVETRHVQSAPTTYLSLPDLVGNLTSLQQDCPSIFTLTSLGQSTYGASMPSGRFSKDSGLGKPRVLLGALLHGDEPVGLHLLVALTYHLCNQYTRDSRVAALVDSTDIHLVYVLNPDGYSLLLRNNANGVDLNRNFPDQFLAVSEQPAPEQEVSNLLAFLRQSPVSLAGIFHGGAVVCNYPWDGHKILSRSTAMSRSPDHDLFYSLCLTYSARNHEMVNSREFRDGVVNGARWYSVRGGLQDYLYWAHNTLTTTIEVSKRKQPAQSTLSRLWENNGESMMRYMEQVHRGVAGTVTCADRYDTTIPCPSFPNDPCPLSVEVRFALVSEVPTLRFEPPPALQERRACVDRDGSFHRVLLPGDYKVSVSARFCGTLTSFVSVPVPLEEFGEELIRSGTATVEFRLQCGSSLFLSLPVWLDPELLFASVGCCLLMVLCCLIMVTVRRRRARQDSHDSDGLVPLREFSDSDESDGSESSWSYGSDALLPR